MSEQVATATKQKNTKWVIFIIIAALLGLVLGYMSGKSTADAEWQKKYDQQTAQYESQAADAKDKANGTVEQGQETLEMLQTENTSLKATVEDQKQEIADLEKQLAEAKSSNNNSTAPSTN